MQIALENEHGMLVTITDYGAIVMSLVVPDRNDSYDDIVLGFDSVDEYRGTHPYFGAVVGRYGNRIAKGRFSLDGENYTLTVNDGENHLHGGLRGFDKVIWTTSPVNDAGDSVTLSYTSPAGEEGYPGEVQISATYTVLKNNSLRIDYEATTDVATPLNLTNHSYFNLTGAGSGDILGHVVEIAADRFTPVDAKMIPTGKLHSVQGTPFDFRLPETIGSRIEFADEQLEFGHGYDHNWVLNSSDNGLHLAARVYEPDSGRVMEVLTTEPGLQFYTGNFLDGSNIGKGGAVYERHNGFCMETQHFPDSPNQSSFPSTIVRPGETYQTSTVYSFTVR